MKLFKWEKGRQEGCEYYKLCFLYLKIGKFGFDGYILKYMPKAVLPRHIDKIDGKMWRLNIKLKGKSYFICNKEILKLGEFLHLFRPDLHYHSLIVGHKKTVKLSIGVAKFH